MADIFLDPITRIEGHLAAKVTTGAVAPAWNGAVTAVKMKGEMFRGFENILKGRYPCDAIEIVQRICGVCPVPHGLTSNRAVEDAVNVAGNANDPNTVSRLVRNLVLGAETLMSHITHFYHLSALSYVQGPNMAPWTPYFDDSYYQSVLLRPGGVNAPRATHVKALAGASSNTVAAIWDNVIIDYVEALKVRRDCLKMGAIFAGRMPMTRSFVCGGVTCRPTQTDIDNFRTILGNTGATAAASTGVLGFVRWHYMPLTHIVSYLYGNQVGATPSPGGSVTTNRVYDNDGSVAKAGYGAGNSNYLSYGMFNLANNSSNGSDRLQKRGYLTWNGSATTGTVSESNIVEYVYNSHYTYGADNAVSKAPSAGMTNPSFERGGTTYSWVKSPRYLVGGTTPTPMQVGPLSRMAVHGELTAGVLTTWESTASVGSADGYKGDNLITTLEAGYRIGTAKAFKGADHPYFVDILTTNIVAITGLFGNAATSLYPANLLCGCSTMDRHRARAFEALKVGKAMHKWLDELSALIKKGRTVAASPTGAVRVSNVVTITTTSAHAFSVGESVTVSGVTPVGATVFNGTFTVASVPSTTTFTYAQTAVDDQGGGGYVELATGTELPASDVSYTSWTMPTTRSSGYALEEAPRGSLGHWITINEGVIESYQAIVPTTWNCCPTHSATVDATTRGPAEEACVGAGATAVTLTGVDSGGSSVPVEVLRIVQSFDPCLACAIHVVEPEDMDLEGRCS